MCLGLELRTAQGFNPDGSEIAMQMDPSLQQNWFWDGSLKESEITAEMGLGLDPRRAQDCNPNRSGIANQINPAFQQLG